MQREGLGGAAPARDASVYDAERYLGEFFSYRTLLFMNFTWGYGEASSIPDVSAGLLLDIFLQVWGVISYIRATRIIIVAYRCRRVFCQILI